MAESLINASAAAVLAAGGLAFLLIALSNDRGWPKDARAGAHPLKERWICGAAGVVLIGSTFTLLFLAFAGHEKAPSPGPRPAPDPAIKKLQREVTALQEGPATVARLAGLNTEIRTLRAGAMAGDASGRVCLQGPAPGTGANPTSPPAAWVDGATGPLTPCDLLKNDAWTVEIQGDLFPYVAKLVTALDAMKVPYIVGPPQHRYTKSNGDGIPSGVGLVFDADAPASLICRIAREYVAATTQALEYVTTQDTVLEFSSPSARLSSYGVRLGVYFPDIFKVSRKVSSTEWGSLCNPPDQQHFDTSFKMWAQGFRPPSDTGN